MNNNNNPKKKALGRGLSALLSSSDTDITTRENPTRNSSTLGSIAMIDVKQIEANPFQPRTHFEKEALIDLSNSIKVHGIIQPVTVRKMGYDKFQLISGERRFRASQLAGLTQIPAYVRLANDQEMLEMALVENIQRENLDAIEVAISYQRLMEECNLTQEQVSEKVAKQRSTVANYLRLLKLPEEIQLGIRDQKISMGHARALITIADKVEQLDLYHQILENELSVRAIEDLSKGKKVKLKPLSKGSKESGSSETTLSFEQQKTLQDLREYFSTEVQLKVAANGKGKIEIPFGSEQDLKIILSMLSID